LHIVIWTSSDGKSHSQIYHVLKDRRWHSSIFHIHHFKFADCETDHCVVVAKVRERLSVSKGTMQFYAVI